MRSNGRAPVASGACIDGLEPERAVLPASAEEVAAVLVQAAEAGEGVAPIGGGTMLSLGNPIERFDIALGTSEMDAILDYEPVDLVLSVQAGARFADVQAALAENGQHLPVETAWPERATIGGMIATARSGPRRLASGSLRDLLIGMSVAHPSGTVTKCGGMVVKNVSGYDLPRVYHGSLGTLGVTVSANFKVVPKPRSDLTLVSEPVALDTALEMVALLQAKGLRVVALELVRIERDWRVAVRAEGREGAVEALGATIGAVLGEGAERLMDDASRQWWQAYIDDQAAADAEILTVRCSVRPRETGELACAIDSCLNEHGIVDGRAWVSPGLGAVLVTAPLSRGGDGRGPGGAALLRTLAECATHTVVLAAPLSLKRDIDIWGPAPETLDLMQALKQQFDPGRVLNPGRFVGRI
ncbi:MAG TPA: FAD-binding oxidoreductase [Thermomicrobiales bacterium]|nr:FAD-binding oxidoreductase [Thermomicrobiales bacterium]